MSRLDEEAAGGRPATRAVRALKALSDGIGMVATLMESATDELAAFGAAGPSADPAHPTATLPAVITEAGKAEAGAEADVTELAA